MPLAHSSSSDSDAGGGGLNGSCANNRYSLSATPSRRRLKASACIPSYKQYLIRQSWRSYRSSLIWTEDWALDSRASPRFSSLVCHDPPKTPCTSPWMMSAAPPRMLSPPELDGGVHFFNLWRRRSAGRGPVSSVAMALCWSSATFPMETQ